MRTAAATSEVQPEPLASSTRSAVMPAPGAPPAMSPEGWLTASAAAAMPATCVPWLAADGSDTPAGPGGVVVAGDEVVVARGGVDGEVGEREVHAGVHDGDRLRAVALGRVPGAREAAVDAGDAEPAADPLASVEQAPLTPVREPSSAGSAVPMRTRRSSPAQRTSSERSSTSVARAAWPSGTRTTWTPVSAGTECSVRAPACRRAAVRSPADAEAAKRTTRRSPLSCAARAVGAPAATMPNASRERTARRSIHHCNGRPGRRL